MKRLVLALSLAIYSVALLAKQDTIPWPFKQLDIRLAGGSEFFSAFQSPNSMANVLPNLPRQAYSISPVELCIGTWQGWQFSAFLRFSSSVVDLDAEFSQSLSDDFPGKILQHKFGGLYGKEALRRKSQQGLISVGRNFRFGKINFQPRLLAGLTSFKVFSANAIIKTPNSNQLSTLKIMRSLPEHAFSEPFTAGAGAIVLLPLNKWFGLLADADWTFFKPNIRYEISLKDEVSGKVETTPVTYRRFMRNFHWGLGVYFRVS